MVYWREYNKVKNEYRNRSTVEMKEAIDNVQRQLVEIWQDTPENYLDTPFYEYMIGDIENTIGALWEVYDEMKNEYALLSYNQR